MSSLGVFVNPGYSKYSDRQFSEQSRYAASDLGYTVCYSSKSFRRLSLGGDMDS